MKRYVHPNLEVTRDLRSFSARDQTIFNGSWSSASCWGCRGDMYGRSSWKHLSLDDYQCWGSYCGNRSNFQHSCIQIWTRSCMHVRSPCPWWFHHHRIDFCGLAASVHVTSSSSVHLPLEGCDIHVLGLLAATSLPSPQMRKWMLSWSGADIGRRGCTSPNCWRCRWYSPKVW